ncbi:unnamed protein product [Sphagnum troendelagicum]|uniref:Post-GPI attachment to proteins factor 3 n=1 Tax=Sphagnum troendelagicum TaxID=128251 RepID=A0ABP0U6R3_9BRYO
MKVRGRCLLLLLLELVFLSLLSLCHASAGDDQPPYKSCVESCEKSGCVDDSCFNSCKFPVGIDPEGDLSLTKSLDSAYELFLKEPLYLRWKKWDCTSECRYQCMVREEAKRESDGHLPLKYHGKWPFVRFFSLQEPASVAFSVLNLLVHFQGFSSFLVLVFYKLPLSAHGSPHYEYVSLWAIYGLLSMNSWIWSTVFHSRDVRFTEMLDYSSAVALLGYSLILAVIRTGGMRAEAARVMVSAPITAFISTHILYLNLYKFDYGWNMQVCVVIGVTQMLLWAVWACRSSHPARYKLLTVVFGASLAMLLEIYDFPPLWGILDAHAIWHATTVPITYLWWSFIKDDAKFRTKLLISKTEATKDNKSRKSQ